MQRIKLPQGEKKEDDKKFLFTRCFQESQLAENMTAESLQKYIQVSKKKKKNFCVLIPSKY